MNSIQYTLFIRTEQKYSQRFVANGNRNSRERISTNISRKHSILLAFTGLNECKCVRLFVFILRICFLGAVACLLMLRCSLVFPFLLFVFFIVDIDEFIGFVFLTSLFALKRMFRWNVLSLNNLIINSEKIEI